MADNIMQRDSQTGIKMGWHKKTNVVPIVTKEIAFPWQVILASVFFQNAVGKMVKHKGESENSKGWKVTIADDDGLPLGNGQPVNLDTYTVRTPQETWDFKDSVLTGTEHIVASAGTVCNRAKFFISSKLVELERVKLDDGSEIELLLNTMGSLDKTLKEKTCVSGVRIVCDNTLMLDFLAKQEFSWVYRHSKNMLARIEKDKPLVEKAAGFSAVVKATFDKLIATPCSKDRAANVYAGVLTDDKTEKLSTCARRMVDDHLSVFSRGDGNAGNSEFDLLNGFTQLRTHGYTDSEKDNWDRFVTSEFGTYANDKSDFAEILINRDRRTKELPAIEARGNRLLNVAVVA